MSSPLLPTAALSPGFLSFGVPAPAAPRKKNPRVAGFAANPAETTGKNENDPPAAIVCFCHLSWNWVWQRPQQFLSRLARKRPVLFVETYCSDVPRSALQVRNDETHPNVTVLAMHLPASRWTDGAFIDRERRRLLREFLDDTANRRFAQPVLWFYDPMAVTAFAGHCDERAIVYDCMDELTQFKGAPPGLLEREQQLLREADVVFCGGRKMREKRLPLNSNCHFYGTGVDCVHFGRALSAGLAVDTAIAALPQPVIGYFGVVDERIDYKLLARLADAQPDWSVVMIGPAAKVDPASFPRRPNLHFLGGRPYADLPAITKDFSVCLMPFALNAATEYINPTKALEYMAAGKPVVSTALDEVRRNFRPVARIAETHDEFVALCRAEIASPSTRRIQRGLHLAADNTWEAIAAEMEDHVAQAVVARHEAKLVARAATSPVLRETALLCSTT